MSHMTKEQLDRIALDELAKITPGMSMKDRLAIPPQEMACQDPEVRKHNTAEVAEGYTEAQALVEANRCLNCKNAPCMKGCPVSLNIRDFIQEIVGKNYAGAIAIIKRDSLLPAICGRVCPQESQCQSFCTVGKSLKSVDKAVAIGRLERFVADWARENGQSEPIAIKSATGKHIAVVGSGPASLAVAADLRREGHDVTIFEAFHKFGGVMTYGIPEFRLPKAIVAQEAENLRSMGVRLVNNFVIGRTRKLTDLMTKDGFDAVFVGTGAGLPHFMGIPGEDLVGVFAANEYLTRANLMRAYDAERADTPILRAEKVAVLGGGNVAMDAARTALRLGAKEVHLIYRRSSEEMPARHEEILHAEEEGVQFHYLTNAKRIIGDENSFVKAIECVKFELGEPDASGRRSPVEIPGSEYTVPMDAVLVAIGNGSNPLISQTTPGLECNKRGNIVASDDCATSIPGVYAGGDIVLGAATVIRAMGQGRCAAAAINEYLKSK